MPNFDGVDISSFQGYPDWMQFAAAYPNIKFISCKATQGIHYVNPTFITNRDRIRAMIAAGWSPNRTAGSPPPIFIPYHFVDGSNANAQGSFFSQTTGPLLANEAIMLDFEAAPALGIPTFSPDFCISVLNACGFFQGGRLPIAYRGYYYPGDADTRYDAYPQWLPAYGTSNPKQHRKPVIWQYGGGPVTGITPGKDVDCNEVWDYGVLQSCTKLGAQPSPGPNPDPTPVPTPTPIPDPPPLPIPPLGADMSYCRLMKSSDATAVYLKDGNAVPVHIPAGQVAAFVDIAVRGGSVYAEAPYPGSGTLVISDKGKLWNVWVVDPVVMNALLT